VQPQSYIFFSIPRFKNLVFKGEQNFIQFSLLRSYLADVCLIQPSMATTLQRHSSMPAAQLLEVGWGTAQ
jgi:hypothetical protein